MATYQTRNGKTRAIVRRKGFSPKSRTFPTKSAAKVWADRVERELAALEAKGVPEGAELTIAEIVDWYLSYLRELKTGVNPFDHGATGGRQLRHPLRERQRPGHDLRPLQPGLAGRGLLNTGWVAMRTHG